MKNHLINLYLEYSSGGETPAIARRWTCLSCIGALLGRNIKLPFQHKYIFPNMYVSLMGPPASRKSTAIDMGRDLLMKAGFKHFSPDNASIQGFWKSLEKDTKDSKGFTKPVRQVPSGLPDLNEPIDNKIIAQCYVMIGELSDFIPEGDRNFITNLTNLYDNLSSYTSEVVSRKTVKVNNPTINLLGGMPQSKLVEVYTPSAINSGFFSRMLFINVTPSGKQVTIPPVPDKNQEQELIRLFRSIAELKGILTLDPAAFELLDTIYKNTPRMQDVRLSYYEGRRQTHLLKLSIILAAARLSTTIHRDDVLEANTTLIAAENQMPLALGSFGRSKDVDVRQSILEILAKKRKPLTKSEITTAVKHDITSQSQLSQVLNGMVEIGLLQVIDLGGTAPIRYTVDRGVSDKWDSSLYSFDDFLLEEENPTKLELRSR